jgi:hypothetical protein
MKGFNTVKPLAAGTGEAMIRLDARSNFSIGFTGTKPIRPRAATRMLLDPASYTFGFVIWLVLVFPNDRLRSTFERTWKP